MYGITPNTHTHHMEAGRLKRNENECKVTKGANECGGEKSVRDFVVGFYRWYILLLFSISHNEVLRWCKKMTTKKKEKQTDRAKNEGTT